MYPVRLKKIESNHQNLRTNQIVGWAPNLPTEGEQFFMYGKSLEIPDGTRYIRTTKIQKVQDILTGKVPEILFYTLNSTYALEIIDESEIPEIA